MARKIEIGRTIFGNQCRVTTAHTVISIHVHNT